MRLIEKYAEPFIQLMAVWFFKKLFAGYLNGVNVINFYCMSTNAINIFLYDCADETILKLELEDSMVVNIQSVPVKMITIGIL